MSIAGVIARGRTAAEALMVDSCVISRVTGQTTDPNTGKVVDVLTEVYSGKCKVQTRDVMGQRETVGGHTASVLRLELHLPITAVGIAVDDRVTVTSSDPDLTGPLIVTDLAHKTFATARRLVVEEVTA